MQPSSWPIQELRYERRRKHELKLHNIHILSHIIYYIVPLSTIIVLTIKTVGFSKVRQTLTTKFARHYGDIED